MYPPVLHTSRFSQTQIHFQQFYFFHIKKGSNLRSLFCSQPLKMSSMASSTAFFTPLHDFTQARTTPSPPLPFIKSSFASSKSTFFHPALSLQTSSNFPRLFGKPKFFSVHARAATEKTIYDFTVKVPCPNFSFHYPFA